jgi:hypothetical protein
MTKKEAEAVVSKLVGWNNPRVRLNSDAAAFDFEDPCSSYYVEATDPLDGRRKVYSEDSGRFN